MAFKVIEIAAPDERVQAVRAIAEESGANDFRKASAALEDGRWLITLVVGEIDRQRLLDRLQTALGGSENWRITMLSADLVIRPEDLEDDPKPEECDEEKKREEQARASREELHHLVEAGARIDVDFMVLVFLSTVVASVGLEQDNVAVLIGAMVIAPLLGPNIAFAFGAAIGDRTLMLSAAKSGVLGVALSVLIAAALAFAIPPNINSHELMARTSISYDGIALALASGAAAALSVTTGLSSTLVGVMVAVALLPPAATAGIMLAAKQLNLAAGATMLLVANVASVNLAAQLVFLIKGIHPRSWVEKKAARRAVFVNIATWVALISILVTIIAFRGRVHG